MSEDLILLKRAARALQARDGCSYSYAFRVIEDVMKKDAEKLKKLKRKGLGVVEALLEAVEYGR